MKVQLYFIPHKISRAPSDQLTDLQVVCGPQVKNGCSNGNTHVFCLRNEMNHNLKRSLIFVFTGLWKELKTGVCLST